MFLPQREQSEMMEYEETYRRTVLLWNPLAIDRPCMHIVGVLTIMVPATSRGGSFSGKC